MADPDGGGGAREGIRLIVMPLCFAAVGLGLLIYGCFAELNPLAVLLAAAAMIAVMGRLIFTFRDNVRMLLSRATRPTRTRSRACTTGARSRGTSSGRSRAPTPSSR